MCYRELYNGRGDGRRRSALVERDQETGCEQDSGNGAHYRKQEDFHVSVQDGKALLIELPGSSQNAHDSRLRPPAMSGAEANTEVAQAPLEIL